MSARRVALAASTGLVLVAIAIAIAIAWWHAAPPPHAAPDGAPVPDQPPRLAPAAAPPSVAASAWATPASTARADAAAEDPICVARPAPLPRATEATEATGPAAAAPVEPPAPDPLAPARAALLGRLAGSADPYANAVAVWLGRDGDDASQTFDARAARLAAMASSTRDPRLYALALRMCWRRSSRECTSLSARRWSEIDPGNAMPWLMLLDEAALRGDVSGMQEALFQAAHAPRLAERPHAPLQAIVDAAIDEPASLAAARSLAVDAVGLAAAQVGPVGFMQCKVATPANANVWQECVALKDLLERRSDTLLAQMLGAGIDKRLTGNAEPGARIAALMARMADTDIASSTSCADLRGKLALLRRMAVEGDAAVAPSLAR